MEGKGERESSKQIIHEKRKTCGMLLCGSATSTRLIVVVGPRTLVGGNKTRVAAIASWGRRRERGRASDGDHCRVYGGGGMLVGRRHDEGVVAEGSVGLSLRPRGSKGGVGPVITVVVGREWTSAKYGA